jgi:AhpD family alkylhydroperoxidase
MTANVGKQNRAYYEQTLGLMEELGKAIPKTMAAYNRVHHAAVADGALSLKVKELMALCIGITVRCDGCIAYHVNEALLAGATYEEIVERDRRSHHDGRRPSGHVWNRSPRRPRRAAGHPCRTGGEQLIAKLSNC